MLVANVHGSESTHSLNDCFKSRNDNAAVLSNSLFLFHCTSLIGDYCAYIHKHAVAFITQHLNTDLHATFRGADSHLKLSSSCIGIAKTSVVCLNNMSHAIGMLLEKRVTVNTNVYEMPDDVFSTRGDVAPDEHLNTGCQLPL
jgi:hypothetical protein